MGRGFHFCNLTAQRAQRTTALQDAACREHSARACTGSLTFTSSASSGASSSCCGSWGVTLAAGMLKLRPWPSRMLVRSPAVERLRAACKRGCPAMPAAWKRTANGLQAVAPCKGADQSLHALQTWGLAEHHKGRIQQSCGAPRSGVSAGCQAFWARATLNGPALALCLMARHAWLSCPYLWILTLQSAKSLGVQAAQPAGHACAATAHRRRLKVEGVAQVVPEGIEQPPECLLPRRPPVSQQGARLAALRQLRPAAHI